MTASPYGAIIPPFEPVDDGLDVFVSIERMKTAGVPVMVGNMYKLPDRSGMWTVWGFVDDETAWLRPGPVLQ